MYSASLQTNHSKVKNIWNLLNTYYSISLNILKIFNIFCFITLKTQIILFKPLYWFFTRCAHKQTNRHEHNKFWVQKPLFSWSELLFIFNVQKQLFKNFVIVEIPLPWSLKKYLNFNKEFFYSFKTPIP